MSQHNHVDHLASLTTKELMAHLATHMNSVDTTLTRIENSVMGPNGCQRDHLDRIGRLEGWRNTFNGTRKKLTGKQKKVGGSILAALAGVGAFIKLLIELGIL